MKNSKYQQLSYNNVCFARVSVWQNVFSLSLLPLPTHTHYFIYYPPSLFSLKLSHFKTQYSSSPLAACYTRFNNPCVSPQDSPSGSEQWSRIIKETVIISNHLSVYLVKLLVFTWTNKHRQVV